MISLIHLLGITIINILVHKPSRIFCTYVVYMINSFYNAYFYNPPFILITFHNFTVGNIQTHWIPVYYRASSYFI